MMMLKIKYLMKLSSFSSALITASPERLMSETMASWAITYFDKVECLVSRPNLNVVPSMTI